MTRPQLALALWLLLCPAWAQGQGQGQPSSMTEQKATMRAAGTQLRAAERLARAGRKDDASAAFAEAQRLFGELGTAELDRRLQKAFDRLKADREAARRRLTTAGVTLAADPAADPNGSVPVEGDPLANGRGAAPLPGASAPGDAVSFVRDVAPMLNARCGECHVRQAKGGVRFPTHNDLLTPTGRGEPLVSSGQAGSSRIVLAITTGGMPPNGEIDPAEVDALTRWIDQGAVFDGADPSVTLDALRPEVAAEDDAPAARPARPPAQGTGTVSFAEEVAPLLVEHCGRCHIEATRGDLGFATFAALLKGPEGGPVVVPGDPDGSPLVRRLTGADVPRMPPRGDPLPAEQIDKISTWVREGARLDAGREDDPLKQVHFNALVARGEAEKVTMLRERSARQAWRLGLPDLPFESASSNRLMVIGAVGPDALSSIAEASEGVVTAALKAASGDSDARMGLGPIPLFVFGDPLDYAEFVRMVERSELPRGRVAHHRADGPGSYLCVLAPAGVLPEDPAPLASQAAALWVYEATGGHAPAWLAEGIGRASAARTYPKSPTVVSWTQRLPEALAASAKPDDFITGKLSPELSGAASAGFASALMTNRKGFDRFLAQLRDGRDLSAAAQAVYGRPLAGLVELWAERAARAR